MTHVFTDGAAIRNGSIGARGGIGVFFAEDSPYNESRGFRGSKATHKVTNQNMELTAAVRGLEIALEAGMPLPVQVCTDSMYTINCVRWAKGWARTDWRTKQGRPVLNKELIQRLVDLAARARATFRHVPAHRAPPRSDTVEYFYWFGNWHADRLAGEGAHNRQAELQPTSSNGSNSTCANGRGDGTWLQSGTIKAKPTCSVAAQLKTGSHAKTGRVLVFG